MNDFLGKKLNIGDNIVAIYSDCKTFYKKGKIIGFTTHFVKYEPEDSGWQNVSVSPEKVIKIEKE